MSLIRLAVRLAGTPPRSRGAIRPSFAVFITPSPKKGRREDRVPAGTRGPLRELHTQEEPHSSIQVWPSTRPSLRDGRTAYAVLSREPMLPSGLPHACGSRRHRAGRRGAASTRLDRGKRRSGPHGFAVRVQRRSSDAACEGAHEARLNPLPRPALRIRDDAACVHRRPDPRLVTTYDRPSSQDQDGRDIRQFRNSVK